jgi:hypothetical protein
LKIDNFRQIGILPARPMISAPSIPCIYQPFAMSAGLHGMVEILTVVSRPWLVETRKNSATRRDEIVIG